MLGDMLCIGSGVLFALTTVSEELLIKGNLSIFDFLALLGFSGTIVSSIQLLVSSYCVMFCWLQHCTYVSRVYIIYNIIATMFTKRYLDCTQFHVYFSPLRNGFKKTNSSLCSTVRSSTACFSWDFVLQPAWCLQVFR